MPVNYLRHQGSIFLVRAICLLIAGSWLHGASFAAPDPGGKAQREPDKAKGDDASVTYNPPLSPADRAVFAGLCKDIDLAVNDTPLRTFARMLAKQTGLNVSVDTTAGIDLATRVSIQCRGMALESALRQALAPAGLDYRVTQGRLVLTVRSARQLTTRTYSVADLCPTVVSFDTLLEDIRLLSHESEWEDMGGWAKLTPDAANRKFTLVHLQSEQEHALRLLTNKRREAKERSRER